MEGKLGAIYINNKQVGGFLDWDVKLNIAEGPLDDNNRTHQVQSWKVTAWSHWVSQQLDSGTDVTLKLCPDVGNGYWECKGKIACQLTKTLHTLIHVQLEVIGVGAIEGRELNEG